MATTRAMRAAAALLLVAGPVAIATAKPPTVARAPNSLADTLSVAGWVTDAAHVLSPRDIDVISARLVRVERRTRHQVVVVTVPTLDGEDIGAFTGRLANRWGIGRRKFNDGVVFLIAPSDRKVRISVGDGLLATVPDARSAAILQRDVIPRFRAGDVAGGTRAGVRRIADALDPDR